MNGFLRVVCDDDNMFSQALLCFLDEKMANFLTPPRIDHVQCSALHLPDGPRQFGPSWQSSGPEHVVFGLFQGKEIEIFKVSPKTMANQRKHWGRLK